MGLVMSCCINVWIDIVDAIDRESREVSSESEYISEAEYHETSTVTTVVCSDFLTMTSEVYLSCESGSESMASCSVVLRMKSVCLDTQTAE